MSLNTPVGSNTLDDVPPHPPLPYLPSAVLACCGEDPAHEDWTIQKKNVYYLMAAATEL